MSTPDLDALSPRELSAGLMRGDRVDMKLGYSAASAAMTAAERKNLSERALRDLLDWSLGYHDGMHDAMHDADPDVPEGPKRPGLASNPQYLQGRIKGRTENGETLYPTAPEDPAKSQ